MLDASCGWNCVNRGCGGVGDASINDLDCGGGIVICMNGSVGIRQVGR